APSTQYQARRFVALSVVASQPNAPGLCSKLIQSFSVLLPLPLESNYIVDSPSPRSGRQRKAWGVSPRTETAKVSSPRSGRQLVTRMVVHSFRDGESNAPYERVLVFTSVA